MKREKGGIDEEMEEEKKEHFGITPISMFKKAIELN